MAVLEVEDQALDLRVPPGQLGVDTRMALALQLRDALNPGRPGRRAASASPAAIVRQGIPAAKVPAHLGWTPARTRAVHVEGRHAHLKVVHGHTELIWWAHTAARMPETGKLLALAEGPAREVPGPVHAALAPWL